ncbi:hypothetical protein A0H81_07048 [Grifola frondosa]|uniref:F-box domain-containing protein n=1 Tax=Grifola frondosa TaxID=5627 RepID=A0A1C7M7L6_GRIFR|nr:hypothetical protein A0H81_07048 [Grifola frondosa]
MTHSRHGKADFSVDLALPSLTSTTMKHVIFPVEILDYIFQELDHSHLTALLRVSSFFHAIAARILYRVIPELSLARCVRCLKTICANPRIALLVHKLSVNWTECIGVGNLFRLLHRALGRLTFLRHLSVELSQHDNHFSLGWMLSSCRAPLQTLGTSIRCDESLAEFLNGQSCLTELSLRGFQTRQPFILSPTAMPKLTSFRAVHAGSPVLSEVIRGRPVEGVSLSLFMEDGYKPLDTLMLSSRPIKRLTIMSLDNTPPNVLLPEVARRLPELEALHIVVLMAQYDIHVLQESSATLSKFSGLRYLTFMAAGSVTLEDEREITELWHKACPSLKTIILPKGKVWFEREGKWTCCA